MFTIQRLRALFNERLTVAAEEIFGVIETTIVQYEEEIRRSKQEINRQLLDILALKRNLTQQGTDTQQPQEDPEPLQIKEEQEELWTSQEGEQHHRPEEADIFKFTLTSNCVKTEHEQEGPVPKALPSTSTEQKKTVPDGNYCGVSNPDGVYQPTSDCSALESDDGDSSEDFRITGGHYSGSKTQESNGRNEGRKKIICVKTRDRTSTPLSSPDCEIVTGFSPSYRTETGATLSDLQTLISKGERAVEGPISHGPRHSTDLDFTELSNQRPPRENITLSCKVCGKTFFYKELLVKHAHAHANHTGLCGVCGQFYENVSIHLRYHMPTKGCRICGQQFDRMFDLKKHMGAAHRGEKSFKCHLCYKGFTARRDLDRHFLTHTGEKPFSCNVCGKRFNRAQNMRTHMRTHTGEKPYGCLVCGQRFTYNVVLKKHMIMHSGSQR